MSHSIHCFLSNRSVVNADYNSPAVSKLQPAVSRHNNLGLTIAEAKHYQYAWHPLFFFFSPDLCRESQQAAASNACCPRRLCVLISGRKWLPSTNCCKDQEKKWGLHLGLLFWCSGSGPQARV